MKQLIKLLFGEVRENLSDREIREMNRIELELEKAEIERQSKY